MTPAALAVYTDNGLFYDCENRTSDWKIRVFPNLYSALTPTPKEPIAEWIALPGYGNHEVIVDSPLHEEKPADFSAEHMRLVFEVYRDRYANHCRRYGINYVSLFKNHGEAAGASLKHSHSQLIALPIIPSLIGRELSAVLSSDVCPYCDIVEREINSRRLIAQNQNWILIAPFFSKVPYEIWVLPKRHIGNLKNLDENQLDELARIMSDALRRLRSLLDDPPYNYMLFQLSSSYHFNIRIQPVLSDIAGFEKGTDIYINSVPPEQASAELRLT